jgi:hypothetical protein
MPFPSHYCATYSNATSTTCIVLHIHMLRQWLAACMISNVVSIISHSGKQRTILPMCGLQSI